MKPTLRPWLAFLNAAADLTCLLETGQVHALEPSRTLTEW
jgi:hypothetical protein